MKLLCIYPYLDPAVNSAAEAILQLGRQGHEVAVLSARRVSSHKGDLAFEARSDFPGVTFHRPFESLEEQFKALPATVARARTCLEGFSPDLIFCSLQHNMDLASALAGLYRAPVVLQVEFARDPAWLLPLRGMGLLKQCRLSWMLTPVARCYWRSLCRRSAAIVVTNPADRPHLKRMASFGRELVYVPWCNQVPPLKAVKKKPRTCIHVGGLNRLKNSRELGPALRILLEETPTEEVTVVGPGPYAADVKTLAGAYPRRVTYIESMVRHQALERMAESCFGLLTAREGALGFIGDAWGLKLPLVSLYNPSGLLHPEEDALVTWGRHKLAAAVKGLYRDRTVGEGIAAAGHRRYLKENTAEAVATRYEKIFERVLGRRGGSREASFHAT